MTQLKILVIISILSILFNVEVQSQNDSNLKPESYKCSKKEIPFNDYRFIDYQTDKQYGIFKNNIGDSTEYFISDLENGLHKSNIKNVFTISNNEKIEFVQFSKTGEQIVYRTKIDDKRVWKIYDIKTSLFNTIESGEGSVFSASIYDLNKYLFITNPENERQKAYLKNNETMFLLGTGISVAWSPNGEYFLLKSPLDTTLSSREKRKYGILSDGEYKRELLIRGGPKREIFRRYMLYNELGEKLIILEDFDFVDWVKWSPNSNKLVIRERGDIGFKIIYLNFKDENNIVIDSVYHFPGFPHIKNAQGTISTFCQTPEWSPDSKRILFTTEVEDGHQILYNNVYVFEDYTYKLLPVIDSSDRFIYLAKWIDENAVIIPNYNLDLLEKFTFEFGN